MSTSNPVFSSGGVYCSDCGVAFPVSAKFCQRCGKSAAAGQPVRAVRTKVAWWDLVLLGIGLLWSYNLVLVAQHLEHLPTDPARLLGRYFFELMLAFGIAYAIAGRRKVRNRHRFCLAYACSLFIAPLLPLISVIGKPV